MDREMIMLIFGVISLGVSVALMLAINGKLGEIRDCISREMTFSLRSIETHTHIMKDAFVNWMTQYAFARLKYDKQNVLPMGFKIVDFGAFDLLTGKLL